MQSINLPPLLPPKNRSVYLHYINYHSDHCKLEISVSINLSLGSLGLGKMANTKTSWKCCGQGCSLTARLLLPLVTCCFLMNIAASYEGWVLWGLFWLVHAAAFVAIIVTIAKLLGDCAWYNEELEKAHCHLWDTREKMVRENRRMEERIDAMRDEIQVQVDELRAHLHPIWNGGL
ncbi:hypothetical protein F4677DRAFT_402293 [Hypoxylon crocopeplum]|nr:hypothetical protein F4677DRAFT_402293 [Hypoxylon crocopeplum]